MIITFLSTSIFWLTLWALREYERWQAFNALSEEIRTLRASDRRLREENQALRNREQSHLQMIAVARDRAGAIRDGLNLGGPATLPAAAEQTGGVSQLFKHSTLRVRDRANGGPGFFSVQDERNNFNSRESGAC